MSVIETEEIESGATRAPTVASVFRYIVTHPIEVAVRRWNWKAAALSGVMRGSIYFATHISLGLRAALGAMSAEFIFRVLNSGASASVSQAFRKATPKWLATVCVMVMLPMYSHILEYTIHTLNGDQNRNKSILFSISFSALSAIFNLFMMRRGTLLVSDAEQKSLKQDLRSMPKLVFEFAAYPVLWLLGRART